MYQFIESIKIKDGKIFNIEYHQKRFDKTRFNFFGKTTTINLLNEIKKHRFNNDFLKCRIIYEKEIQTIEFTPYSITPVNSLKIVEDDEIDYTYKTVGKSDLIKLKEKKMDCDEILIIKNGFITDTSRSNVAFFDGYSWFTPKTTLLEGTKRSYLIDKGILTPVDIKKEDIKKYQKAAMINALIDLEDEVFIDVKNIVF